MGWIVDDLKLRIENQTYEKTLINQVNFEKTLPEKFQNRAKLAVKDEYLFDFLDLGEEFGERELERAAISGIEAFLREMGGVFTFAGSQHRGTPASPSVWPATVWSQFFPRTCASSCRRRSRWRC